MDQSEKEQANSGYNQLTRNFRLLDDDFMTLVFGGNVEATHKFSREADA